MLLALNEAVGWWMQHLGLLSYEMKFSKIRKVRI